MIFTKNVRLKFSDEEKEFIIKMNTQDLDELCYLLEDYGIDAEVVVNKAKKSSRRAYKVFGRNYYTIREFCEQNNLGGLPYQYNSRHLMFPKAYNFEMLIAIVIYDGLRDSSSHDRISEPEKIKDLINKAIYTGKISGISLHPEIEGAVIVYKNDSDISTCEYYNTYEDFVDEVL